MSESLVVNEIYLSLQGESTFAGLPCIFVRLTACDLRCSYCDTAYAFSEGHKYSLDAIYERVKSLAQSYPPQFRPQLPLVELTGGEPLLQPNSVPLMHRFCTDGFTVLLETSGAHDISSIDPRVHRIIDLKCPSSGEANRNRLENLQCLRTHDEVKFVIATREDYEWAKRMVFEYGLPSSCPVLFSWAHPLPQQHPSLKPAPAHHLYLSQSELAEAIITDALPVRFQLQMHKVLWGANRRGV